MEAKPNKEEMVRFLETIYKGTLTEEIEVVAPNECITPQVIKVNVKGLMLQVLDLLKCKQKETGDNIQNARLCYGKYICPDGYQNFKIGVSVRDGEVVTLNALSSHGAVLEDENKELYCIPTADFDKYFKPIGDKT